MSRSFVVVLSFLLVLPSVARAHCDTLDGPLVGTARRALETGKVNPVLAWVRPQDEAEIRAAFARATAVRRTGPDARSLADTWFLETVVRVHRTGEGAPYTGLKPAGQDLGPGIRAADASIDTGSSRSCRGPARGEGAGRRPRALRPPEGAEASRGRRGARPRVGRSVRSVSPLRGADIRGRRRRRWPPRRAGAKVRHVHDERRSENRMPGPIASWFAEDHARLDRLLRKSVADPGAFDGEAFETFRAGLLRHIALEEKFLLPGARKARGGDPLPVARRLRVNHGAIASLLVPTPDGRIVAELRSILEPHNAVEEGPEGLYETCDRASRARCRRPPRADSRLSPGEDGAAQRRPGDSPDRGRRPARLRPAGRTPLPPHERKVAT